VSTTDGLLLEALREQEFAAITGAGAYLNSASTGPLPARAVAALSRANRDRADPRTWTVERANAVLERSRHLAARLINATSEEIALMPNTTTGVNVAAWALPLSAGDVVLTFDREFPTNIYPWLARARDGVVLERVPVDDRGWPDQARLEERLGAPEVRAVCVSLSQFSTGWTVDLARLSQATRALDKWLILDAIQGLGHVPVDVVRTPVDFLAAGAQKWLLSPWGTGFLYVRRALIETIAPTFAGWAAFQGTDDYSRLTAYDPRPWPDGRRFEVYTLAVQDFAAMNASLEMLLDVGIGTIAAHAAAVTEPLLSWAADRPGRITSPRGAHQSAIVCVRPEGDVAAAHRRLTEAGIAASLREGSIRISPHLFNTRDELAAVAAML
jgi:selenocysteine lyase/cysteine desulfurase